MAGSFLTERARSLFGGTQPAPTLFDMVGMVRYALLVALILSSSVVAHANDGIALEVYVGDKPRDAERIVEPVLTELERAKIVSAAALTKQLNTQLSVPSRTDKGLSANFVAEADAGERLYAESRFTDAINKLTPLVNDAHDNSGAFAKDPTNLQPALMKALTALALAHNGAGDASSMYSAFDEMVRSFPNATVTGRYGPDAVKAFEASRKRLMSRGTGKLKIKVQTGVVFVDESVRGSGSMTLDVPVGDYRVVVIAGIEPSRTHLVTVKAGEEATVTIDAAFDQALHTGAWTGFSFATVDEREKHAGPYAAQLARALNARSSMLVGVDPGKPKPQVFGSIISLDSGNAIRGATVALEPDPSRDLLKALARYLVGDAAAPGLEIVDVKAKPVAVVDPDKRGEGIGSETTMVNVDTRWGGWRWLSLSGTIVLAGTGGALYALNGACKTEPVPGRNCTDIYNNRPYDKILLGAAVPAAILTVYLIATQTKTVEYRAAASAYLVPTQNGAVAGYAFTW